MTTLLALCRYRKYPVVSQPYWNSFKLVQALKGREFKKYADIPVGRGKTRHLTMENAGDASSIVGEMSRSRLTLYKGAILVPMPDSGCTVAANRPSKVAGLAQQLTVGCAGVTIWDGLRWTEEMTPATQGGTRDPSTLFDKLLLAGPFPQHGQAILVDDVVTSGGHLRAAAARLNQAGHGCTQIIAAARTVDDESLPAFETVEEEFESFTPFTFFRPKP